MTEQVAPEPLPLTPVARLRPDAVPGGLVSSGGHDWVLAGGIPRLEAVWDRLYDSNLITGGYDEEDLIRAGVRLIRRNFDLTPDEAASIVVAADVQEVKAAVETALIGPEDGNRTYSDWARSALWANGIDPASVPCDVLRHVLDHLVMAGRAVPQSKFINSAEYAGVRSGLLSFAAAAQAEARAKVEAAAKASAPEPAPAAEPAT